MWEPHDPIPNSTVKPHSAQGTAVLTVGEQVAAKPNKEPQIKLTIHFINTAGWSSPVARQAHNLKVVGSNPTWIYDEDDDAETYGLCPDENREMREYIAADPKRYLLIPGLSHGEHHDILRAFLQSGWTEDESQHAAVRSAYVGSIID